MTVEAMLEEIGKMDADSQRELAWKLWDSLEVTPAPLEPTPAQKADLGRRMAELDADPTNVLTHAELLARVRRRQ